jgi:deoxyribose-phosphate aldolase
MKVPKIGPKEIASIIDHTFLKTEKEGVSIADQKSSVERLVQDAHRLGAFSVCVRESMVDLAKRRVQELKSRIKIVSVIGFPDGDAFSPEEKTRLLEKARQDGADEFDMVIRVNSLKGRDYNAVYRDILAVSRAAGESVLKVIFENAYLEEFEKKAAYAIAMQAFLDGFQGDSSKLRTRFLKSSTGFAKPKDNRPIGATLEDITLMHDIGGGKVGLKPAGGVNNLDDAIAYFNAAGSPMAGNTIDPMKFRIGASGLLAKLFEKSPDKKKSADY